MEELIVKQRELLTKLEDQVSSKKATIIEVSTTVIAINKVTSSMLSESLKRIESIR